MRRSSWGAATAVALGFFIVAACTADGTADPFHVETDPTEPVPLPPAHEDPEPAPGATAAPRVPAAASEAGSTVDAGPPPPEPGTPCTTLDERRAKRCGVCGSAETLCERSPAGALVWGAYSACRGEVAGGCEPGTTSSEPCGYCGSRPRTCGATCKWTYTGQCGGQPAGACNPGSREIEATNCPDRSYRVRTCDATTCGWSAFTECAPPPGTIEVPRTVGSKGFTYVVFDPARVIRRLKEEGCPTSLLEATTPFAYVKVHNPHPRAAKVTIFNTAAPGGPVFGTLLATYTGAKPADAAARARCTHGVAGESFGGLTSDDRFASLDVEDVVIGAGKDLWLYNGAKVATASGTVQLVVRLDGLQ